MNSRTIKQISGFIALVFVFILVSTAWSVPEVLEIKRVIRPEDNPRARIISQKQHEFVSDVSRSNILRLEREHPGALPYAKKGQPISILQEDTLTVLGLRVEFQEEVVDDPMTTGNGLFDMRDTTQFREEEGHFFDTAPHNEAYFSKHMEAMSHFWWEMSGHTLHINYEIWPPVLDSTYHLPYTIKDYHDEWGPLPQNILGEYFRDVIQTADSVSPDLHFTQADGRIKPIIVFHPGSDNQSDLWMDTPRDFYTGFLFLYEAVVVDSGATPVTEGIIMPETVTQDYYVKVLNSVMAHEFGHVLGLRDFYNTCQYSSMRLGNFSLMDNNYSDVVADFGLGFDVYGVLPASLDIFSRAYLGFVTPTIQTDTVGIELVASGMLKEGDKCIKVPIDANEYFLLENLQIELDYIHEKRDDLIASDAILLDSQTSVVMGPGYAYDDGGETVKVVNGEFDRLMEQLPPDSLGGVLIYRVDEVVAYGDILNSGLGNWDANTLQCDPLRWFIRIMEADTQVSFGNIFHAGSGSTDDLFPFLGADSLTANSRPFSSLSNSGAATGIQITNIGGPDTTVTLDIKANRFMEGWPKNTVPGNVASHPVIVDVDGDGKMEVFMANWYFLTAFNDDGTGVIDNNYTLQVAGFDKEAVEIPLKVFAVLPDTSIRFIGTPSIGDIDGDSEMEVVVAASDNKLYAFEVVDNNGNGLADSVANFPVTLDTTAVATTIITDYDNDNIEDIYIATLDGKVSVYNSVGSRIAIGESISGITSGIALGLNIDQVIFTSNNTDTDTSYIGIVQLGDDDLAWSRPYENTTLYEPVVGDINRDSRPDIVVSSSDGKIIVHSVQSEILTGWPVYTEDSLGASAVIADIDRNGYPEIIIPGNSKIHCYNFNGTIVEGYPADLYHEYPLDTLSTGIVNTPAVVGDITGDGVPNIMVGSPDMDVFVPVYNPNTFKYRGQPMMAVGTPVNSSPFVFDLDGDNDIEIGARGGDGYINILDAAATFDQSLNIWPLYGGSPAHRFYHPDSLLGPLATPDFMPDRAVYAWPNPTHFGTSHIRYRIGKQVTVDVNIKIFDVAGNLMGEYNTTGIGPSDNEYVWDCSSFASGVYLARVEAKSAVESKHVFTKIAVVR
ncbi:MAG: T9SS type A sorting domain-containing protein [candidate division Zixibacteria bacterium]|nr:T9SS type A sorting domain-containing protein [candidate division Zixibacteria bacterium]